MKTKIKFLVIALAVLFFTGYVEAQEVKKILGDARQRNEVFFTILGDDAFMNEFIQAMGKSERGKMMMSGSESMKQLLAEDAAMRKNMMSSLIGIAAKDNTACTAMCEMIMKDEYRVETINKHPR